MFNVSSLLLAAANEYFATRVLVRVL